MKKLAALLLLSSVAAMAAPRIFYSKFFKGSVPEFVAITVERDGQATYQEAKDDENPLKIKIGEAEVQELFDLAAKLDNFKRPLESGLNVAHMGTKTLRFEDDAGKHEVEFNYSTDVSAQALWDRFERITETEQHFVRLERAVRYDKLGVNEILLQLQISYEHKRIVAPEQFLALLDRVARNDSYMHIARERAASLGDAIRKPQPASSEKTQL